MTQDSEDVVLLGQAILDESAGEHLDEGRQSSKLQATPSKLRQSFEYESSLLTASDVRQEVNQELRAFAAESLSTQLLELGAKLKREFRGMLEDVLATHKNNRSSLDSALSSYIRNEKFSSMDEAELMGLGVTWKEEMRALIESEFAKQFQAGKVEKQAEGLNNSLARVNVKPAPAPTPATPAVVSKVERPAPFSSRPYRAYVAHEAMQEYDVKVKRPRTGDPLGKSGIMKRSVMPVGMWESDSTGDGNCEAKKCQAACVGLQEPEGKLQVTCKNCGNIFMADARFCRKCGIRRTAIEDPWASAGAMPNGFGHLNADADYSGSDVQVLRLEELPADQAAGHPAIVPNGEKSPFRTDDEKVSYPSRAKSPPKKMPKAESQFRRSVKSTMESLGDALQTRPRHSQTSGRGSITSLGISWDDSAHAGDATAPGSRRSSEHSRSDEIATSSKAIPGPVKHKLHREAVFITKEAGTSSTSSKKNKTQFHLQDADDSSVSRFRHVAITVVNSVAFDIASGLLIAVNAIWIGIQVDLSIKLDKDDDIPGYFRFMDTSFAVLFTLELGLRLFVMRCEFFFAKSRWWNMFDVLLVAFQVSEEILAWSSFAAGNTSSSNSTNFSFMRILRILRFIRVLRLVRIVRLIGELRTIVCSIGGSLKSLGWTIVLMTLQIYVVGIYFTQLVADHGGDDQDLDRFFGSLARSILSLFAAFTGGVDWDTLASPLIHTIHPFCGVVFALYIAFAVLAMMNVVTGVFVESALMTARHDKDVDLVNTLREVLVKTDEDSTGTIEWDEFERHILDPQMEVIFKAVDLDRSEARGLFELIDVEDKGEISREEFIMGCLRLKGPAKALDLATLMYDMKRMTNMLEDHFDLIEYSIGNGFSEGLKAKEGASKRVAVDNVTIDHSLAAAERAHGSQN